MATDRISPTAHYTSYVWVRAGLSPPELGTPRGRRYHAALAPFDALFGPRVGAGLEQQLLLRHRAIDAEVERAIAGGARQVLEVAAGLSGRAIRLGERHPEVRFVEADLPDMAAQKRRLLASLPGRRVPDVVDVDALATDGPLSLSAVAAAQFDTGAPIVVITEGLLSYLPWPAVQSIWRRVASLPFPVVDYLSDVHLGDEVGQFAAVRAFISGLSLFARGQVYLHHANLAEAVEMARGCGFASADAPDARLLVGEPTRGGARVRVLRCKTTATRD
ncbi:MAG: class I SAM-dependent methyltransferase [Myxococcales bacterium]|nr:class I SAM-dependent methyltransferase [Myxococcales bacterium]MCB9530802.1 class I SAM-dependent methyltransferase [Myxococcales bacterium]